jgi:hypothetical protein
MGLQRAYFSYEVHTADMVCFTPINRSYLFASDQRQIQICEACHGKDREHLKV